MLNLFSVGAGGFLGAVCRYGVSLIPVCEAWLFPIKTFIINVIGCVVIGAIAAAASKTPGINPHVLLFLKVGLCGGFTTFSTFALETADLMKSGHMGTAFLYVVLSALTGVAVIFAVEYWSMK